MRHFLFFLFGALFFWGCQKDNNNTTTESTHSCGATDVHHPTKNYGTVQDIDGNTYKTIQIGTQTWMAENLKTTKYRNGTPIENIADNMQWQNNKSGAYCSYNNNTNNDCPYGKLYNWYAISNSNQLCPTGWHVPTDAELTTLTTFLGGDGANPGNKLKNTGSQFWYTEPWESSNSADNSSGFSGLPGGNRWVGGSFGDLGDKGCLWTSTEFNTYSAWKRYLYDDIGDFGRGYSHKENGFSVRCIKD